MPGDADAMLGQAGRQARQRWRQAGRGRGRGRTGMQMCAAVGVD